MLYPQPRQTFQAADARVAATPLEPLPPMKADRSVRAAADRRQSKANERLLRALTRDASDVIAVASPDASLRMVSEAATRAWGRNPRALVGSSLYRFVHPNDRKELADAIEATRTGALAAGLDVRVLGGNDVYRSFRVDLAALNEGPGVQGVLLTFHDLSEQRAFERELTYHAFHDRLTGLANRDFFMERLAWRIESVRRGDACAALSIGIDNFKYVNDSLGHPAGDALLVAVAKRLQGVGRPIDTVARLDGDEFAVLLDSATPEGATSYAGRLKQTLHAPIQVSGQEVFVTASIGIAMCGHACWNAADVLRDAGTAMHHAKAGGKGGYAMFDPSMNEAMNERLELASDLRRALEREEFVLQYQPIVDLKAGKMRDVEALIRWEHPTRGTIPPCKFIPIAEETGLICDIGRWVLEEGCRQLALWQAEEPSAKDLCLSVNVSGLQFQQPDFVRQVGQALHENGVAPHRLTLEVTETMMMEDLDRACDVLERLREVGVRIALDDFGTGYSSISYLCRLPVDTLKIDRSFVNSLGADDRVCDLIQSIIAMAKGLSLSVTCEGIETSSQLHALRSYGGDRGQGYFFARPQSALSIGQILASEAAPQEQRRAA